MLLQQVELTAAEGQASTFENALCEVRQRVFMSPGFRGFTVAQGVELGSNYLVEVRWESSEELAEFIESRFERCWAPVEPFLARVPKVEHFVERPGLGLQGPGVVTDLAWLQE